MDTEILTLEEAADLLRVAPDAVATLLSSGKLAGREIAGQWRTTRRAIVCYVEGTPIQMACCTPMNCCPTDENQPGGGCCC